MNHLAITEEGPRMPTASGLQLAATCPGSAVLPRVDEVRDATTAGSVKHAFLEACNRVGREAALRAIENDDLRAICEAINLEGLPLDPAAYAAEVTFAWSLTTGEARELGRGLGRDYRAATPDEIVGTADIVALVGDDRVFVGDWKGEHDEQPSLRRHHQLRFLALAAARAYGRDGAIVEIIRPGEDRAWRDRLEIDMFDLLTIDGEVRELAAAVLRQRPDRPDLVVGEHCRRCRSNRFCPAFRAVVGDVRTAMTVLEGGGRLTAEDETRFYHHVKALEALAKLAKEVLQGLAHQRAIQVDEEHVYGQQWRDGSDIIGRVGIHVLIERFGEEAAWKIAELKIPKERAKDLVRATLGPKPARGALGKAYEELLDDLRQRGGLRDTGHFEYRKHKAARAEGK